MRYPGRRNWGWDSSLLTQGPGYSTLPQAVCRVLLKKLEERGGIYYRGVHKKLYTPAATTLFQQHSQTRKPFASSWNATGVRRKVPLKISFRATTVVTPYVRSSLAAAGCCTFMFCPSKLGRVKQDAKGNRNSNSWKSSLTHLRMKSVDGVWLSFLCSIYYRKCTIQGNGKVLNTEWTWVKKQGRKPVVFCPNCHGLLFWVMDKCAKHVWRWKCKIQQQASEPLVWTPVLAVELYRLCIWLIFGLCFYLLASFFD